MINLVLTWAKSFHLHHCITTLYFCYEWFHTMKFCQAQHFMTERMIQNTVRSHKASVAASWMHISSILGHGQVDTSLVEAGSENSFGPPCQRHQMNNRMIQRNQNVVHHDPPPPPHHHHHHDDDHQRSKSWFCAAVLPRTRLESSVNESLGGTADIYIYIWIDWNVCYILENLVNFYLSYSRILQKI